ncbi:enoyl-CoA hydratase/isomerase family protein (plasmid) [Rhodococcus pseudokoreensis]|uniref:Enoyl-CoA hydratase/isomerase family protein n=1 Tax=Rhodococcus pseudokoreensis TaxID=2811421 RepID=A0A974VY95_9NOCA|nr:enoyl-CoA hydratase-related protein [Rhodococcus pseudokoreensis]QSE87833.1 enoyl-CoA hydratase/isomerase family protein [Rhodococcus pseudokoreensis]
MTITQESTATEPELALRQLLENDPPADLVTDRVALQRQGSVAVVTLSHPKAHNALALASWQRLRSIFDELAHDPTLRAAVIRGAGTKAFAAGADIKEFPRTRMTAADATHYNEFVAQTLRAVSAVPVPVIAAIRGLAVGGGCELSTACDVRIATEDARFGIPIGRLGVILGYTEADAAARLIGPAALKYLLFSGDLIYVEDAQRLGLVQKIVPTHELASATAKLVTRICCQSAVTMRASKLVADMHGRALTAADTELLSRLSVEAYEGEDLQEGVAAFEQGRRPVFNQQEVN